MAGQVVLSNEEYDSLNGDGTSMSPSSDDGKVFVTTEEANHLESMDPGQDSWKNYVYGVGDLAVTTANAVKMIPGVDSLAEAGGRAIYGDDRFDNRPVVNPDADPESLPLEQTDPLRSQYQGVMPELGVNQPSTPRGEDQAQAAKNISAAAPFIPFAGPLAGIAGLVGALTAPFAARKVGREYGEGAGTAADLGMAAVMPFAAETAIPKAAQVLSRQKLAQYAKKTATPQIKALLKEVNRRMKERIPDIGDLSLADLYEHASDVKSLFPFDRDPNSSYDFIGEAIAKLEKTVQEFPNPFARPRSTQSLGKDLRRQTISEWEEQILSQEVLGGDIINIAEGQQASLDRVIRERYQAFLPEGTPEEAVTLTTAYVNKRIEDADELWKLVPFDDIPQLDPTPFNQGLVNMIEEAGPENADLIPPFLKKYLEGDATIDNIRGLQRLRSRLLEVERGVDITNINSGATARLARTARKGLDDMIDALPVEGGAEYSAARTATRESKMLTDPRTPGIQIIDKIMLDTGAVEGLGAELLKSKEGAERIMGLMGHNPDAVSSLERTAINQIFGDRFIADMAVDLGPEQLAGKKTPVGIREALYKYQRSLPVVVGEARYKGMVEIADWIEQARSGRLATVAKNRTTGSNASKAAQGVGVAKKFMTKPIATTAETIAEMLASVESDPVYYALMQEVALDPEVMVGLLKVPVGRAKAAYVIEWKKAIARATAKVAALNAADNVGAN